MLTADERKHQRFTLEKVMYVVLGVDKTTIAKLKDISLGGLSCHYLSDRKNVQKHLSLDIFSLDDVVHIYQIPYTVVYNNQIQTYVALTEETSMIKTRRFGLKFGKLSRIQQLQLQLLIEHKSKKKSVLGDGLSIA